MSTYLIINILIIFFPLVLSFDKNITYYKKIPQLFFSILIVSTAYIIWDSIATKRGDWAFSPEHLIGIYFFGLPIEEILFFITVPYSCVFIYETVKFYVKGKELRLNKKFFWGAALLLLIISIIFNYQHYTFTVTIFTATFFIISTLIKPQLLNSYHYWLTMLISFVPFLIVNYFLTSIPVVTYNETAFFGKRFLTIPLEDFLYSFSMISLWILFYEIAQSRRK
ncbi:MAG: lycopene cyclase domain-containing protein [Ignavibacterium sp.]|uniref:lycopene cyclase domain-containing protein n=1 Tax=Ignavibacterium sp. TaxID=2651167 RepID=UPI00404AFE39